MEPHRHRGRQAVSANRHPSNRGCHSCDLKIVFWENETRPLSAEVPAEDNPIKKLLVMLGPEGGFTDQEIEKLLNCGFMSAGLGPRILRAETATIVAVTLVQYIFGDMGPKASNP
jgi:16S rRNA (uracil1498-N3)-methyltransferase